jgi:hypothetical protein
VRKADNLPPSCAVVTKSGSLNFLEFPGPLQACVGTALPFTGYRILKLRHVAMFAGLILSSFTCAVKGKMIPLQARCGPEGG